MDVEGRVLPGGRFPQDHSTRGKDEILDVKRRTQGTEEARPTAGSWQGRRASAEAGAGPRAHAIWDGLRPLLRLEELWARYPRMRVVHSSSKFVLLTTPVTLLEALPFRAHIFLEVPINGSHKHPMLSPLQGEPIVPDARAWAIWREGVLPEAYHRYPDQSICAFRPGEWRLGRDPLRIYLHSCVLWLTKLLHLHLLDSWPGPQHCSASVRVKRNRPDEFCGCGSNRRWRDCCMPDDLKRSRFDLLTEELDGSMQYLRELNARGWPDTPPWRRRKVDVR